MRRLTNEEIEKLASKKNVKRIAVENFLSSMGGLTVSDAYGNLGMDARLYKWNAPTRNAISKGIEKAR